MDISLDPMTERKIRQFGKRRRKLILYRGICTFVTLVIVAFGLVGLVDYLVFMEDWVRYVLSGVAYAALLFALYKTCLKQLAHKSDLHELAIMFEMADPSMREKLLSVVELGNADIDSSHDSAVFRELIQRDVAQQVRHIKLESILPRHLIHKWMKGAAGTITVFVALLLIPNLQFMNLMLRAVAPGANLDRVSNIKVSIIKPSEPNGIVPEGEKVPVVIELSDSEINSAYLETHPEGGKKEKVSMEKIGDRRFAASINVGKKDIQYRVRAHTALTRYYTLSVKPRPYIKGFETRINFPEYAQLPSKTKTPTAHQIGI